MSDHRAVVLLKDGTMISDEKGEVFDLLPYCRLQLQIRVKVAANSGQTLQLQHAAVNEEAAFTNLDTTHDIATAGTSWLFYDAFLRYIRVVASGSISTQPVLSIFIIVKEM